MKRILCLIYILPFLLILSSCSMHKYDREWNEEVVLNKIVKTQKKKAKKTGTALANKYFRKNYFKYTIPRFRDPAFYSFFRHFDEVDTLYIFERLSELNSYYKGYIFDKDFEGIMYDRQENNYSYNFTIDSLDFEKLRNEIIFESLYLYDLFDIEKIKNKRNIGIGSILGGDILLFGRIILNKKHPRRSEIEIFQRDEWAKPIKIIYE
ncbi:MAG: hypothetical protein WC994_07895 [Brumimicrobium sp.]